MDGKFHIMQHLEGAINHTTLELPHHQLRHLPPKNHGQDQKGAVHHAGDAEDGLDDRVPDLHGQVLDAPGALGEEEEVDIHEEHDECGREISEEKLDEEDEEPDERVGAHQLEEASRGRVDEVGLGEWAVDGHFGF